METDLKEFEKCKNDPYYFFTKYCLINGETPTMARDQFNEKTSKLVSSLKRRGRA